MTTSEEPTLQELKLMYTKLMTMSVPCPLRNVHTIHKTTSIDLETTRQELERVRASVILRFEILCRCDDPATLDRLTLYYDVEFEKLQLLECKYQLLLGKNRTLTTAMRKIGVNPQLF